MAVHTVAVVDLENLVAGRATPVLTTHLTLSVIGYPVFGLTMVGLILATARERQLASPWVAWLGILGSLAWGAAAPLAILTELEWAGALFPGVLGLALWLILAGIWPRRAAAATTTALLIALSIPAASAAGQDPADSTAARSTPADSVVDAFHSALERGDSTAALSLLAPDVRIYESGDAETLEQYRSGHLAADIEFAQSVESQVLDGWTWLGTGEALVGRVYRAEGSFRGRPIDAITTETIFLLRTAEGTWRIRHIHWSSRRASPPPGP